MKYIGAELSISSNLRKERVRHITLRFCDEDNSLGSYDNLVTKTVRLDPVEWSMIVDEVHALLTDTKEALK